MLVIPWLLQHKAAICTLIYHNNSVGAWKKEKSHSQRLRTWDTVQTSSRGLQQLLTDRLTLVSIVVHGFKHTLQHLSESVHSVPWGGKGMSLWVLAWKAHGGRFSPPWCATGLMYHDVMFKDDWCQHPPVNHPKAAHFWQSDRQFGFFSNDWKGRLQMILADAGLMHHYHTVSD